jgi:predicted DNA-binding transcriptional regulator AlpA
MNAVDTLLRASDVCDMLSISTASLYRRMGDGTLPKPIKLGSLSRWSKADIERAIDAARQQPET